MKRLTLVLALVVSTVGQQAAAQTDRGQERPCQYPWWRSVQARENLVLCLSDVRHAPGSPRYVLGIGRCESGWDLVAPEAHYSGTFQQLTSAWSERLAEFQSWAQINPHYIPPTNVRANTAVSIHMAKMDGTWTQEWSCA